VSFDGIGDGESKREKKGMESYGGFMIGSISFGDYKGI
jgi:hypothetical protein